MFAAVGLFEVKPHLSALGLGKRDAGQPTKSAHIAALAIEHNAEDLTFDRGVVPSTGLRYLLLSK